MVKQLFSVKSLIFVILLVGLNFVAQQFYYRLDFTKEKRYTLTEKTKETLKANKHKITITVFLDGDMPSAFKRLKNATKDILNDFKAYSKADFKIEFVNPIAGLDAQQQQESIEQLYQIGIKPTNINLKTADGFSQKIVFPMAMVECDGKQMPVKLLQNQGGEATSYEENINNSIQNLEYILTSSLKKVISGYNPRIGFTEGNGEPDNRFLYDAINALSESYVVGRVNLDSIRKEGLDSLKMLIIAKPLRTFTETQKFKINYFVMKGGSVVWTIDQVRMELDSLRNGRSVMAVNNNLNLDDMLFEYGARINYNLLADANCAEIPVAMAGGVQGNIQLAPWLYYPLLIPDNSNNIVRNLDQIRGQFVSTVDTIGSKNVHKQIILHSSPYNKVYNVPKIFNLQMIEEQAEHREFNSQPKSLGVLLEGHFKNVFANRPVPEEINQQYNLPEKSQAAKMMVIGDGDTFVNQVSGDGSPFALGYDRYSQQSFGNKMLLLNLADYFTSADNLIDLRNKEVKVRLLDKMKLNTEKSKWQLINTVLPLILLIIFAIFQHYFRKHKYAK